MCKLARSGPTDNATCPAEIQVRLLSTKKAKARARRLLAKHHYLGEVRPVGEQLFYAITDAPGHWLGVSVFCAAARRLRARDRWIGWTEEQRRRRLPLVVNNCRFLLLPDRTFPNLGSRSLRLTLARLSADWQARYGHPVVLVETFVDPERFSGASSPPMVGGNWAQPTALAASAGIFMSSTTNPNVSSSVNCARTPVAVWPLSDSDPRWRRSKPKPAPAARKLPRKSVRWSSTSRRCPTTARASAFIRSGAWSPSPCWLICAAPRAARKTWPSSPEA